MTLREFAKGYLLERGIEEDQIEEVLGFVEGSDLMDPAKDRWNDPWEEYRGPLRLGFVNNLRGAVCQWIDATCPQAWFKLQFAATPA